MSAPEDSPRAADVHQAWQDDTLGRIRVACPAIVQVYDPATLTVVVQLSAPLMREDPTTGALVPLPVPPLRMPVAWPTGSGISITWPLAPGSTGMVVFADRSTDGWRANGIPQLPPTNARRFGLEDGHFVPMLTGQGPVPSPGVVASAALPALVITAPAIQLGGASAVSPVALAPLVLAELARLWVAVELVNQAIPGGVPNPAVTTQATAGAGPIAAVKTKAE